MNLIPAPLLMVWNVASTAVLEFFSNKTVQRVCAYALVAVALLFVAYQRGYSDRESIAKTEELKQVELALHNYASEVTAQRQADAARYDRDTTLVMDMNREAQRIRTVTNTLTGHINDLAEASSSVQLSVGALRLLNDAKAGAAPDRTVPGSAGGTPYADPAPSGLGFPDLIRDGVLTAEQYNTARNQCNALINWANRELVDANRQRLLPK